MDRYTPLSLTAQTAYAQLLDVTQTAELVRSVASLRGSFARKTVKGRTYWYFQYTEVSGRLHQLYVGPDNERVQRLIQRHAQGGPQTALEPLANAAIALGCEPVLPAHFRVARRLADYGFFKAGGVLVGTHAFLSHGNMLGVRWTDAARTQDVDFAHAGKQLSLALPTNVRVDTRAAIESLEMGFLPVADIAGRAGGGFLNPRDPEFRLDFLTPLHRGGNAPYKHPQLEVDLQPLKFIEFILENVQQAALFCAEGSVLVNVPHPARYALHKVIVAGERPATRAVKSNKDRLQTAAILSFYRSGSDHELQETWADLIGRGPGWSSRARRGRDALAKVAPELDVVSWLRMPGDRAVARTQRKERGR